VFDVDVALVIIALGPARAMDTLALTVRLLVLHFLRPLVWQIFNVELLRRVRAPVCTWVS
jgi:hypothetical protein